MKNLLSFAGFGGSTSHVIECIVQGNSFITGPPRIDRRAYGNEIFVFDRQCSQGISQDFICRRVVSAIEMRINQFLQICREWIRHGDSPLREGSGFL